MTTTEIITQNIKSLIEKYHAGLNISLRNQWQAPKIEVTATTINISFNLTKIREIQPGEEMLNIFNIDLWFNDVDEILTEYDLILETRLGNFSPLWVFKPSCSIRFKSITMNMSDSIGSQDSYEMNLCGINYEIMLNLEVEMAAKLLINSRILTVKSRKDEINIDFRDTIPELVELNGKISITCNEDAIGSILEVSIPDNQSEINIEYPIHDKLETIRLNNPKTIKKIDRYKLIKTKIILNSGSFDLVIPSDIKMEYIEDRVFSLIHKLPNTIYLGQKNLDIKERHKRDNKLYRMFMNSLFGICLVLQFFDPLYSWCLFTAYFLVILLRRFGLLKLATKQPDYQQPLIIRLKAKAEIKFINLQHIPLHIEQYDSTSMGSLKLLLENSSPSAIEVVKSRVQVIEMTGDCFHEVGSQGYRFRLIDDSKQQAIENAKFFYEHFKKTNRVNETKWMHILFLDKLRIGSDKINEQVSLFYAKITNNYGYTWFLASLWVIFLFMSFRLLFMYNVSCCTQDYIDTWLSVITFSSLPKRLEGLSNAFWIFGTMKILYGLLLYQFVLAFRKSAKAE